MEMLAHVPIHAFACNSHLKKHHYNPWKVIFLLHIETGSMQNKIPIELMQSRVAVPLDTS